MPSGRTPKPHDSPSQEPGQATTSEEAMDATTDEDGRVEESAYAPTPEPDPPSSHTSIAHREQRR